LDEVLNVSNTTTNTIKITNTTDTALDVTGGASIQSNLKVGTANLFVDTTTGNVGVGVTNPLNSLVVKGKTTIGTGASTTNSQYHDGTLNVIGGGTRAILRVENNNGVGDPTIILGEGGGFTENTVPTIKKIAGTNNLSIMTAGNVGIGTTNPKSTLDVHGRVDSERYLTSNTFPLPDPNQHSFRYVCMITDSSVPYGLTQAGGCIYEYNPSTGDTVRVVEPVSEPTAGTFTATAGREYFTMGSPMTIVKEHRIVPFTNLGSLFGFVEGRYDPSRVYLYTPYSNVSVEYFHNTSVTGTPTSTINLPAHEVTQFTCTSDSNASGSDSHIFNVKGGRILMSSIGDGGDNRVLAPLSTIVYGYYNVALTNDIYLENNVTKLGKCVYSNQNVPLILSQGGDGDGGDGTCGIPFELVADTYIVPHDIRGWMIQFLYTETVVNVAYWSATNSQWEQYGTYSPSGTPSIISPEQLLVGRMGGTGADISETHTLWMFTGTKDFTLTVEEYSDGERIVSGFKAYQVAQQIQTNLFDKPAFMVKNDETVSVTSTTTFTDHFPDVYLNVGGHYDTNTGVFTAPYEGTYIFYFAGLHTGGTGKVGLTFLKNGTNVLLTNAASSSSNGAQGLAWNTTTDEDYVIAIWMDRLQKGDEIQARVNYINSVTAFFYGHNHGYFSGYLI
jgi:hypothetical protein